MSVKKRVCPKCGSKKVLEIIYGLINLKPNEPSLNDQGYYIGGCLLDENSKKWHCDKCDHEWGKYNMSTT